VLAQPVRAGIGGAFLTVVTIIRTLAFGYTTRAAAATIASDTAASSRAAASTFARGLTANKWHQPKRADT